MTKFAIVQQAPALLDVAASLDIAVRAIAEAATQNAKLIIFPEAFLGGYPAWIWRLRAQDDAGLLARLYKAFVASAIDVENGDLDRICEAARAAGIIVVIGMNEASRSRGATTVFNSVAIIDSNGDILNVHRKLMPTGPERTIWGQGDASGLQVVETDVGRIGTLICWENYMPLARAALYAQGMEILAAPTWDHDDSWIASMRHIAKEGACWVLSTATSLRGADIPFDIPGREHWVTDEGWICRGEALAVRPFGTIVAGPAAPEQAMLYADLDLGAVIKARRMIDVAGHYARPDVFALSVDRTLRKAAVFNDQPMRNDGAKVRTGENAQ